MQYRQGRCDQQQQQDSTAVGQADVKEMENEATWKRKMGRKESRVRAAAKKHGDTKGIHTHASSEQQQHRHSTAQASEQGADGGGGVLTAPPIDVTDAGMAMVPVRSVW